MKKFIGRKEELQKLNTLYNASGFQMAVIYGRRRIGKSTLIAEFIKDKKAIYYMATKVGAERNVELLGQEVLRVLEPKLQNVSFKDLETLLSFVGENISEEKNEEYYEIILSEIKHMEEMVVDMLDLSHKKEV